MRPLFPGGYRRQGPVVHRKKEFQLRRICALVIALSITGALIDVASAQGPSRITGHDVALEKCSTCHIVAADQDYRPLVIRAPSFSEIADRPDTTPQSLDAYLSRPHTYQKMPYPSLSASDLSSVTSYIMRLRSRH